MRMIGRIRQRCSHKDSRIGVTAFLLRLPSLSCVIMFFFLQDHHWFRSCSLRHPVLWVPDGASDFLCRHSLDTEPGHGVVRPLLLLGGPYGRRIRVAEPVVCNGGHDGGGHVPLCRRHLRRRLVLHLLRVVQ